MRLLTAAVMVSLAFIASAVNAQYFEYDPDDPELAAPVREGEKVDGESCSSR